jgi:hypothetical protein
MLLAVIEVTNFMSQSFLNEPSVGQKINAFSIF